ncbi:DNA replication/checkpoint protein [Pyronema omphalodes]|nr:DNA replication/checkpoint protein [Pyronema omphalodes]
MSSQAKSDSPTEDKKQEYIQQLRQELKDFEHAYAKENGGKKPSKDAVKKDVAIAEKYKEYNRLRAGGSSKSSSAVPSKSSKSSSNSKPTSSSTSNSTSVAPSPRKPSSTTFDISATPTKNNSNSPWAGEIYESPLSVRRQRLLGRRDQVGPTPQKTGRVLGIFDSFIDVESTPPRSIHATPSKKKFEGLDRVSASPASIAKSHKDDSPFLTPRKRKLEDLKNDDPFATPTALRSWAPPAVVDGEIESPKVRRPPSMPKRGLSSLLKELKEMEEHMHDDDEEALREMEAEAEGGPPPEKKKEKKKGIFDEPELPPLPPGAFVEETLVDEDEGKEGDPQRVWKKKGLKRQHRRVIMRPVAAPKTKKPEVEGEEPEGPEEEEEEEQQQPPSDVEFGEDPFAPIEEFSGSGSDFEDVDSEGDGESKAKKAKNTPKAADNKKALAVKGAAAEKATTAKGPARKINPNATSHMNFQKLNIKNKNSKGKGRGGARFGRRR